MSEFLMPVIEKTEMKSAATMQEKMPIISFLGVVEGEVLDHLEVRGPTSLDQLIQAQEWPASLVMMAVGALIRQRLVGGSEQRLALTEDNNGNS